MDIREKTGIIVQKDGEYLVARQIGTGLFVWSRSPWDAWITRSKLDAYRVAYAAGGEMFLFNPVAGKVRRFRGMTCPNCNSENIYVVETRSRDEDGIIRRRRKCSDCGHTFRTYEVLAKDLKKLKT